MATYFDKKCMKQALQLAKKGNGMVSPNPMVGAVIAKSGKILGKGFHENFGSNHAEANAIKNCGKKAKGATLYVTLEPCNHFGKTPPCTKAIIEAEIKKVFVAVKDPNPLVCGKGIQELKKAGIETETGLMGKEAMELNEKYFYFMQKNRPFVALKFAITSNGMISWGNGKRKKISGQESMKKAYELRGEFDCVLVGIGTIKKDDSVLTSHSKKSNNPLRIVVDSNLEIPLNAKVLGKDKKCVVVCSKKALEKEKNSKSGKNRIERLAEKNVTILALNEKNRQIDLMELIETLGKMGVSSLLVEGGQKILTSFIAGKLAQKAFVFVSPKIVKNGLFFVEKEKVKKFKLKNCIARKTCKDVLIEGKF